jgi:hypothetical protein
MTLTLVPKKPKTNKNETETETETENLNPDTNITLEEVAHNLGYSDEWIFKNIINASYWHDIC